MADKPDTMKVENGRLIVDVALPKIGERSASGKSDVFFTTHGNVVIEGGFVLGMNLYKKAR